MVDIKTKEFIAQHASDDVRELALKSDKVKDVNIPMALQQIKGKQKAIAKIPSWAQFDDILYPEQLSMEQCSSEQTALYKASLVDEGNCFIDLTGGLGVDFSFIAQKFEQAIYVEQKKELISLAKNNFFVLKIHQATIVEDEAFHFLNKYQDKASIIFIDPARRSDSGKKTVLIEDCTPNLVDMDYLLDTKSKQTMIKLSPMLDITQAVETLNNIVAIHVVSVRNECKELLFIKQNEPDRVQKIHCVNILSNGNIDEFIFTKDEENSINTSYSPIVYKYLYEPNSSILKAGGYKCIAQRFNIKKLHPNSHLYTSDQLIENFPGRIFVVEKSIQPNKKEIKNHLNNITQSNITTRNYPLSISEIRKQLKIRDGGDYYIFGTTLADEKKRLILCKKLPH